MSAAALPEPIASPTRETLTREAIVSATRVLIETEGLDELSLRRVGAALGVTAPALYAYVKDKRDLLRGVAESAFADMISRFERIEGSDPLQRMRQSSRAYIDYAIEHPEMFKTMFLFPPDFAMSDPTGEGLPIATQAFELPLAAITAAIDQGIFGPIDPIMAALTLWTATHGCADVLLLGFALDDAGREALITNVLDTVIAGLVATASAPPTPAP
jgi:AcrR family transcriptional regulator